MELTKDYLDKRLEKQFIRTKVYFDSALEQQTKGLEQYTQDALDGVIEAMASNFDKVEKRLDKLETSLKLVNADAYQLKEAPSPSGTDSLANLHQLVAAAMAKRGRKWPSHPSGQETQAPV